METSTIRISSRYQMVIPKAIREAMALKPGDELIGKLEKNVFSLYIKPQNYTEHLLGRFKQHWSEDNAIDYLKKERACWESPNPKNS